MDEIIKHFTEESYHKGILKLDGIEVGKAHVDLIFNPFDVNNMHAEIRNIEWHQENPNVITLKGEEGLLTFESLEDQINLKFGKMFVGPWSEINSRVLEYVVDNDYSHFNEDISDQSSSYAYGNYYFPLIHLIKNEGSSTFHDSYGYLRGWMDSDDKPIKWNDTSLDVKSQIGNFLLYDSMIHKDVQLNDGIKAKIILSRTRLNIKIDKQNISFESAERYFHEISDVLSLLMTLIEGYPVNWQSEDIALYNQKERVIKKRTMHKWSTQPSQKMNRIGNNRKFPKDMQKNFLELVDKYSILSEAKKKILKEVMYSYTIASRTETLETQLLYWHSCLDALKSVYNSDKKRRPFSQDLIAVCEYICVEINDLSFKMGKNKTAKFRFNEIRDKYLHEGLIIEDHQEVVKEIRKMKALTERMILKLFDIDYKNNVIGHPYP